MSYKKVTDLPFGVQDDIIQWFDVFEKMDWITLASLFARLLSFMKGFKYSDYKVFLDTLTPNEWVFMLKYTEDRETLSKLKDKILKEVKNE